VRGYSLEAIVNGDEDYDLDDLRQQASEQLDWQADRAARYQSYYDGEQDIPVMLETDERRAFRRYLQESGANWCELVVNAVAERLQVVGFQFGASSDRAWDIWQANQMDADAELVQTDALVTGQAPVLIQPDEDNPTGVSITPESPLEACVLYEPGSRRRRVCGYKRFNTNRAGQADDITEILILPDVIATWYGNNGEPDIEDNPAGVVGLVEIVPQPRTSGAPRSELKPAVATADRINTLLFNRLVASDYGAFRQIWATGVRMAREVIKDEKGEPRKDSEGRPRTRAVKPFDIGANRLLANESPEGRFGSFPESTLQGYLAAVSQDVEMLAAITQTPPHYLLGQMVNLSADAIKAAEAGLVAKVKRRALHIGEAWEEVIRLALGMVGDPAATDISAEVIWADFETRSESQRVDALQKMSTLGVPTEILWQRWGATPQEVDRWRQLAAAEQAQQAANQAAALGAADIAALLSAANAGPAVG
jgi:hypothetical protein